MTLNPDDQILAATRPENCAIILADWTEATCVGCGATVMVTRAGRRMLDEDGFKPACLECVAVEVAKTGQRPEPPTPELLHEHDRAMVAISVRDSLRRMR